MRYPCWSCTGEGCDRCEGTGEVEGSRIVAWTRRRRYLGIRHPRANADGNEKWVRLGVEIPPEFLPLLIEAHRKRMGINFRGSRARGVRAEIVRAALYTYLESILPEEDAPIDVEAVEIIQRAALGSGESSWQLTI